MKTTLRISLLLNLALLGSVIFLLAGRSRQETVPAPVLSETKPAAQAAAISAHSTASGIEAQPFRWSQLEVSKSYPAYIANLRAIGCPEETIEDIVRGDADRAFSWERSQLALDGSGTGPWSRQEEMQLVASLLGGQPPAETAISARSTKNSMDENNGGEVAQASVPSQNAKTGAPSYPLFLQDANWDALGFSADQQANIAQVRQQFLNDINGLNQKPGGAANQNVSAASPGGTPSNPNPNDSAALTQWQTALQNADDQLRESLGAQGYMAYAQQQYYAWYQPQVIAADGGNLTINPAAFSLK